jgi:shikimate kinase
MVVQSAARRELDNSDTRWLPPAVPTVLFIIGPAGVGKTTCGQILARELNFGFVDLDAEFDRRLGDIQDWIEQNGYVGYCRRNTDLFHDLVHSIRAHTVFAVSSGFLMYQEEDPTLGGNAEALRQYGISILLLPSESPVESVGVVVDRLLLRRPWLDRQKEARKFLHRYDVYRQYGDIQVFSKAPPDTVAREIRTKYEDFIWQERGSSSIEAQDFS